MVKPHWGSKQKMEIEMKKFALFFLLIVLSLLLASCSNIAHDIYEQKVNSGAVEFQIESRPGIVASFYCEYSYIGGISDHQGQSWSSLKEFQKWLKGIGNDSIGVSHANRCVFTSTDEYQWVETRFQDDPRVVLKKKK